MSLRKALSFTLTVACAAILMYGGNAEAYRSYLNDVNSTCGTAESCGLCHIDPSGGGPRNADGTAFADGGHDPCYFCPDAVACGGPAPECLIDADCDDGIFCNGAETCDAGGTCQPSMNPCAVNETCDEVNGCVAPPPPACTTDADCDDGALCNGVETCQAGQCVAGMDPCAPGETCNEVDGCVSAPQCASDADCDDGLFCNGAEVCRNGACAQGSPPCATGETCDEVAGCTPPSTGDDDSLGGDDDDHQSTDHHSRHDSERLHHTRHGDD